MTNSQAQTKRARKKVFAEIKAIIARVRFLDRSFRLLRKGNGYLVQIQYMEADVDVPGSKPTLQRGRKWYVSPWSTETEIVETCFAAARRSMEHVVGEHFTYDGLRVYSPHIHIDARRLILVARKLDKR